MIFATECSRAMMGLESAAQDEETRYFVLLWKQEFSRAATLAEKNGWQTHSFSRAHPRPHENSMSERSASTRSYWPTVKLSDVAHVLGDSAGEKAYRERKYGVLRD